MVPGEPHTDNSKNVTSFTLHLGRNTKKLYKMEIYFEFELWKIQSKMEEKWRALSRYCWGPDMGDGRMLLLWLDMLSISKIFFRSSKVILADCDLAPLNTPSANSSFLAWKTFQIDQPFMDYFHIQMQNSY